MALLSLKQETIETFAANATQQAMMVHRRVNQKKNSAIESVPLLKKMKEKVTDFDQKMTKRFGSNYTKTRNIAIGAGKFYIAGQFGGPGIVALGAINAAKAVKPLLKHAEEQRQAGNVSGLFDYMAKNPKETMRTLASASLGAGAVAFGLSGMLNAKFATRAAATALVVAPEIKVLKETVQGIVQGKKTTKQALKDLGRDTLTLGISAASFIAGNYGYFAEHSAGSAMEVDAYSYAGSETGGANVNADMETVHTGSLSIGVKGADKVNSGTKTALGVATDKTEPSVSKKKPLQKILTQQNNDNTEQASSKQVIHLALLSKEQKEH